MLGFWTDLPWWVRLGLGLAVTAVGVVIVIKCVHGGGGSVTLFVDDVSKYQLLLGFAITGIGFGMLMIGGRSDSEKNGYKF